LFHAEDGIRDRNVPGVQTCALPISNSPIVSIFTLFSMSSGKYVCKNSFGNRIIKSTSDFGLFQFSVEKAYNVKIFTLHLAAALTTFLTASMPSLCPATRGNPRFCAHRPFPSMMMATWCGILSKSVRLCCRARFFLKKGSFIDIIVLRYTWLDDPELFFH